MLSLTKPLHLVTKKNISDHWKEKVLPKYALEIIKLSFQILLIIFCIFLYFLLQIFLTTTFFYFSRLILELLNRYYLE